MNRETEQQPNIEKIELILESQLVSMAITGEFMESDLIIHPR